MSAYESYFNLQKSVQKTGTNLETFSSTLRDVEKCLSTTQLQAQGELDEAASNSVLDVLESMSTVKTEYNHLRQDLQEVQQLQREMASTLQYQLRSMTQTYNILKKRIESSTTLPVTALPPNPALLRRPQTAPTHYSTTNSSRAVSSLSSSPPSN